MTAPSWNSGQDEATAPPPSPLQGEDAGPVGEQAVVAAGVGRTALVEELQVAGVDGVGLVGVGADELAVADVVGPGRTAVGPAGERIALGRRPRCPGTVEAA